jgi:glycosyltransferase involved in cell wall biosynthesis
MELQNGALRFPSVDPEHRYRRRPLRALVAGQEPPPGRLFFLSHWFRDHNNPRYAELLPRLQRVDAHLAMVPEQKVLRGLTYRAIKYARPFAEPRLLHLGAKRYDGLFTTENEQIPHFAGPVVSDVDDPVFTEREAAHLSSPNVRAYVVTEERAARRFQELGVETPYEVVPQGVDLSAFREQDAAAIATARRAPGDFVVGYMAAWLLTSGDRGGWNPLYNVEHLLELWPEIRARVPRARLWLLGGASREVEGRARAAGGVELLGRIPRSELLAHVANFDVGLYPRAADQGIQSVKIAEYMGVGVPTVAYDYEVTQVVRTSGGGVLVETPRDFVGAVVSLAEDEPERARLAAASLAYGGSLDWRVLAERYNELLDRHLPLGT